MTGIVTLPLVPLRQNDNERSEMISQLLFGELVEIHEIRDRWLFVCNLTDNYKGWVDRKMINVIEAEELNSLLKSQAFHIYVPLSVCKKTSSNETMFLPGGSKLFTIADNECVIADENFKVDTSDILMSNDINAKQIIQLATQFLNAPYLWGGKSVLGIDCSGLVQVVFSICGIQLPRDADQQVNEGEDVASLSKAQTGDLAFFENAEGKIIHVGILLNSKQIIHASGWVKIENIDQQGIISNKTGEYTHKLKWIKRLI
ncbi:MAG: C40 family peptidase [Paludibacter sp.]|nr:C40 family peptidase [Paludibacter sp.]